MTTPIMIVADDLTGALDSAAPFASRGLNVRVALGIEAIADAVAATPDVIAIDTQSRALPARLATEWVKAAWAAGMHLSPRLVIKKVDSRMKGEVAAETAALAAVSGRKVAIVCPAIPHEGRIVRDGHLSGRGVDAPVPLAARFEAVSGEYPDAEDAAGLDKVARQILSAPDRFLAVGARGLTSALAELIAGPVREQRALALPMVMAIGSRDPITDAQVAQLRLDHPQVHDGASSSAILLLRAPREADADPTDIARQLGHDAAALVRASGARTLLCCGGDTASAVMAAMNVRQLSPEHELQPGVPVARIEGEADLRLITKSGGFGDVGTLSRIAGDALSGVRKAAA